MIQKTANFLLLFLILQSAACRKYTITFLIQFNSFLLVLLIGNRLTCVLEIYATLRPGR